MYQANSAATRRQAMVYRIQASSINTNSTNKQISPTQNSKHSTNAGQRGALRQQLNDRRTQRYGSDSPVKAFRESEGTKRDNIQMGTYKSDAIHINGDRQSVNTLKGNDYVSVSGSNNVVFAGPGQDNITLGNGTSGNRIFLGEDTDADTVVVQGLETDYDVLFNADERTIEITNKETGLKQYIEDATDQDIVRFDNKTYAPDEVNDSGSGSNNDSTGDVDDNNSGNGGDGSGGGDGNGGDDGGGLIGDILGGLL